ncbi:MAG: HAMP domain-containing sensor histidine kinase [Anaerolineales bacterium]
MFTSLRSRLWLSYALVITIALGIVIVVLFVFLVRNPVLYRETTLRLRAAQSQLTDNSKDLLNDAKAIQRIAEANNVRVLIFDSTRNLILDSSPDKPKLSFPRKNILGRTSQFMTDADSKVWLHTTTLLPNGNVLIVAAPRPSVRLLNVFADELLTPILQGGVVALLLSLILAFVISRWVADPLQKVVLAARNYPTEANPVPSHGPREVQDLTNAFNSMIRRVNDSQRSQRDFVANVSHELKTPLTSIQGFAQAILDDTADSPDARKQAAQIIYDEAGGCTAWRWIYSISPDWRLAPPTWTCPPWMRGVAARHRRKIFVAGAKSECEFASGCIRRSARASWRWRQAGASVYESR